MLPLRGLSVWLSITFVHCAQTAEDIDTVSFAHDSPMAYTVQPHPPQILPQSDPPIDMSVGDIRRQIAAEWLEIAQRSRWRAYKEETTIAVLNVTIADPLRPPLSSKWGIYTPGPTSRRLLPPDKYGRRCRQAVCCAGCHFEPGDIAFCQITLAFVIAIFTESERICDIVNNKP